MLFLGSAILLVFLFWKKHFSFHFNNPILIFNEWESPSISKIRIANTKFSLEDKYFSFPCLCIKGFWLFDFKRQNLEEEKSRKKELRGKPQAWWNLNGSNNFFFSLGHSLSKVFSFSQPLLIFRDCKYRTVSKIYIAYTKTWRNNISEFLNFPYLCVKWFRLFVFWILKKKMC